NAWAYHGQYAWPGFCVAGIDIDCLLIGWPARVSGNFDHGVCRGYVTRYHDTSHAGGNIPRAGRQRKESDATAGCELLISRIYVTSCGKRSWRGGVTWQFTCLLSG